MAGELKPARKDVFIFSQSFSRVLYSLARPRNPLRLKSNGSRTCPEEPQRPFLYTAYWPLAQRPPPSLFNVRNSTIVDSKLHRVTAPPNMDQEKLVTGNVMAIEHRPHNASPSQKTAMPRWRGKGKEKSIIAHACTWVVDHQISTFTGTPMCSPSQC